MFQRQYKLIILLRMFQKNRKIKSNPKVCDLWIASNTVSPTTWYAAQLFFYSEDWSKHAYAQRAMAPALFTFKARRIQRSLSRAFSYKSQCMECYYTLKPTPLPFTNSRRPQLETIVTLPTSTVHKPMPLNFYPPLPLLDFLLGTKTAISWNS